MTMAKYEWERIRIEYVQGRENGSGLEWPTLEQLAQENSIPPGTIRKRSSREGWAQERHIFVTLLEQKTREKALEQLAEKAAQLDVQAVNVARAMFATAARRLHQSIEGDAMTLADQERLLRMCDLAHKMGRRALGIGDRSE